MGTSRPSTNFLAPLPVRLTPGNSHGTPGGRPLRLRYCMSGSMSGPIPRKRTGDPGGNPFRLMRAVAVRFVPGTPVGSFGPITMIPLVTTDPVQTVGHCEPADTVSVHGSTVLGGVPAGLHSVTGMFVQVNGGSTKDPPCGTATAGPVAVQLMGCGTAVLLQIVALTVTHVPGLMGTFIGVAQVILHLPACCAFHSANTSAGVNARRKISTSSIAPRKKLLGAGKVPAPTKSELLLPSGATMGPPWTLTMAPSR